MPGECRVGQFVKRYYPAIGFRASIACLSNADFSLQKSIRFWQKYNLE